MNAIIKRNNDYCSLLNGVLDGFREPYDITEVVIPTTGRYRNVYNVNLL